MHPIQETVICPQLGVCLESLLPGQVAKYRGSYQIRMLTNEQREKVNFGLSNTEEPNSDEKRKLLLLRLRRIREKRSIYNIFCVLQIEQMNITQKIEFRQNKKKTIVFIGLRRILADKSNFERIGLKLAERYDLDPWSQCVQLN